VTVQPPSGNRWEPAFDAAPHDDTPPRRTPPAAQRARMAGAAAALFLGSAAGGYLVGHDKPDDAPVPGLGSDQRPGPGSDDGGFSEDDDFGQETAFRSTSSGAA
jgi:hypothetical protein